MTAKAIVRIDLTLHGQNCLANSLLEYLFPRTANALRWNRR